MEGSFAKASSFAPILGRSGDRQRDMASFVPIQDKELFELSGDNAVLRLTPDDGMDGASPVHFRAPAAKDVHWF